MVEGLSCGRDASNKDDYCDSNKLPRHISFTHGATAPSGRGPHHHHRGFTITLSHTTLGRTPLDEWSVRRRGLYLTTNNTHNRQTSMPRRGSNLQSKQANGYRPKPSTARPLGSATLPYGNLNRDASEKSIMVNEIRDVQWKIGVGMFRNKRVIEECPCSRVYGISIDRQTEACWYECGVSSM